MESEKHPTSQPAPITETNAVSSDSIASEPDVASVFDYLLYGCSLPERALRVSSAMVGGVLRESTELLVPQAFRSSRSYGIFVQQGLDFLSENIGGVRPDEAQSEAASATNVEGFVARKAVGNFVELAGLATLHISPITVLAVLSDVAYGSNFYLKELSRELKKEGIIAQQSTIDSTSDLLEAISNASGVTAQAFDLPPLSAEGLKETIAQTRQAIQGIDPSSVLPKHEISRIWSEMQSTANREGLGLFEVSSAISLYSLNRVTTVGRGALSTVRVAGSLFDQHIIDFYIDGLSDIQRNGIYASLAESSRPYFEAVWENFRSDRTTVTEDLLSGRTLGRVWRGMVGWLRPDKSIDLDELGEEEASEIASPCELDEESDEGDKPS